jgi:hypothetical protein
MSTKIKHEGITIVTEPFFFEDHTFPKGFLPRDMRAQACWWFYVKAENARNKVGDSTDDQTVLEGDPWLDTHYVQQKKTTAVRYGLESPDEMDKFWPYVAKEAGRCGMQTPKEEYMKASPIYDGTKAKIFLN